MVSLMKAVDKEYHVYDEYRFSSTTFKKKERLGGTAIPVKRGK